MNSELAHGRHTRIHGRIARKLTPENSELSIQPSEFH